MSKMTKAVAVAVLAMGASAAQAGITIPAGDWTIDIGGNVNAYYTNTNFDNDLESNTRGAPTSDTANNISTGLLPSALGIGGKTRQNDLDIAFQFTFFTGVDSSSAGTGSFGGNNGLNSLNIRQAFLTFGDKSWGTIKAGRDLGIFGSDAILSDMTLLGVGTGAGGNGSSTLGRIGAGYLYADWVNQISYASPNWNGFSFNAGLRGPWGNSSNEDLGYEGKAAYEWGGDVSGKVWVGGVSQRVQTAATAASSVAKVGEVGSLAPGVVGVKTTAATNGTRDTAHAWEIGGKINVASFGLVGYYYDGQGIGQPSVSAATLLSGLNFGNGDHDVKGGYVQATWVAPFATKFGVSWGKSEVEAEARDNTARIAANATDAAVAAVNADDFEARTWVVGAYHPLTKSLNLVAEYTSTEIENNNLNSTLDGDIDTIALGAILFF